ncbi:MAG: hypothetical protein WDN25_13310 [Acetobacteraceae bacterium]
MSDRPAIGEAFVSKQPDGSIGGDGQYCGFPIELRLDPDERNGKRGYRVRIMTGHGNSVEASNAG